MLHKLLEKYNVPSPRYTSYPTVPLWKNPPEEEEWKKMVGRTFRESNQRDGISLYIHLPFCESLCTFCGCNKRITKNHQRELPYIETLLQEWNLYLQIFPEKPKIKEIHLGGGTPTFFQAENLHRLLEGILTTCEVTRNHEFSLEAHPNVTTPEQLETLYKLGFRRLSLGVQDFDPLVQKMINRIQSFETVASVSKAAREIGYTSLNFDLVYGLPFQKKQSIIGTMDKVSQLRPERIAFYSYAHVPWKSKGQRRYTEEDLPSSAVKRDLYELGRKILEKDGYSEIGMDHFSLPQDNLYQATQEKTLHRNFMGYTTSQTKLLLALGMSSISDTWDAYIQVARQK